jgi:hypothetical protein
MGLAMAEMETQNGIATKTIQNESNVDPTNPLAAVRYAQRLVWRHIDRPCSSEILRSSSPTVLSVASGGQQRISLRSLVSA